MIESTHPEKIKEAKTAWDKGATAWNAWRTQNPDLPISFKGANLSGKDLKEVNLSGANLIGADLSYTDLSGANLSEAGLIDANLTGAILIGASMVATDFTNANLSEATLNEANLRRSKLSQTNLRRAKLTNIDLIRTNLRGANLSEATLIRADLRYTDATGADFSKANLAGATLREADLSEANLSEATVTDIDMTETNLSNTDLTSARLIQSFMRKTNVTNTDLSNAIFWDTTFTDLNLNAVKGLDTCRHQGPSSIDYRTLERSGELPLSFLRGIGLPDLFIDYLPSLLEHPIQYYTCFISYSSQDQEFTERLYADLQNNGVRCWYAPEDMKIGDKLRLRIDESIRLHEKLLLVLSNNSIKSDWVEDEVESALEKERSRGEPVLFPVRLDDAVMDIDTGWPASIRRKRHIGDFREWKDHDAYMEGFERLLRDLKVSQKSEH